VSALEPADPCPGWSSCDQVEALEEQTHAGRRRTGRVSRLLGGPSVSSPTDRRPLARRSLVFAVRPRGTYPRPAAACPVGLTGRGCLRRFVPSGRSLPTSASARLDESLSRPPLALGEQSENRVRSQVEAVCNRTVGSHYRRDDRKPEDRLTATIERPCAGLLLGLGWCWWRYDFPVGRSATPWNRQPLLLLVGDFPSAHPSPPSHTPRGKGGRQYPPEPDRQTAGLAPLPRKLSRDSAPLLRASNIQTLPKEEPRQNPSSPRLLGGGGEPHRLQAPTLLQSDQPRRSAVHERQGAGKFRSLSIGTAPEASGLALDEPLPHSPIVLRQQHPAERREALRRIVERAKDCLAILDRECDQYLLGLERDDKGRCLPVGDERCERSDESGRNGHRACAVAREAAAEIVESEREGNDRAEHEQEEETVRRTYQPYEQNRRGERASQSLLIVSGTPTRC
jgi:hypothetical protein